MKIFVSSTFVDLGGVRSEVCYWLTGVFGAELIIMETFGSVAAPSTISSVRRVRECDVFVGIYARRYGSVDKASGRSITELELDEAKAGLSAGVIQTILLYMLRPDAEWPQDLVEDGAASRLERLFEKAKQQTATYFSEGHELAFLVLRDVYRRSMSVMERFIAN